MLEVKQSKPRTLLQWYKEKHRIDMKPSYQRRGDLWSRKHKQLLINSILNRFDVPKIYLADFTYFDSLLKERKTPYAVIDGKQRLTIFFDFFNDKLALDDTPVYHDGLELKLKGLKYSDLKSKYPVIAKQFEEFIPTVMSVISDNLEDVQELFIRLNLNVSISGPERRNAMRGPMPKLIRKLSVHVFFRNYATFPINRGQDLNSAAKALLMEQQSGFANTKKKYLDEFVLSNKDKKLSDFEGIYQSAYATIDKMTKVFEKHDQLLKSQALFPVYYWLVKKYANRYGKKIRDFLSSFEEQRAVVRSQAVALAKGENIEIADRQLLEYTRFIRTSDDRANQEFMYNELEKRLKKYA